jgi:adenine deaminase
MNFPGVVNGDEEVMAKLYAAQGRPRDGHAPGVRGKALNAYVAAGIGSDHETTTREEGLEKLRRGMYLMIREGSAEKNLEDLMPLVTDRTYHRCILVSDDRNAKDLHSEGDVDAVVRKAIRLGLDPIRAIQMATINPARYFGLKGLGAIAPGYWANLMLVADIEKLSVQEVYYRGRLVARDGQPYFEVGRRRATALSRTMNVRPFTPTSLELRSSRDVLPVIGVVPGQIVTRRLDMPVKRRASVILPDTASDVLMLAAVERHHATGNIGVGLVHGFGLNRGALATSVAHDSHNIVVLGVDKEDMYVAVKELEHSQGGLVVVEKGKVLGCLPLPIAGLLSPEPLEKVAVDIERLESLARGIGCVVASPFSVLSFLALPVIPELKLTDRGVVDVLKGEVVSLA